MRARWAWCTGALLVLASGGDALARPRAAFDRTRLGKLSPTVELQGGIRISREQFAKEVDDLQEALEKDNLSIYSADHKSQTTKLYVMPNQAAETTRDKSAFSSKLTTLRAVEAKGFSTLLVKKGTPRPFLRGGLEMAPPGSLAPAPPANGRAPAADDDPLQVTYEEVLGSKNRAALFVAFGLKDTGDTTTIGCDASLDGGVYLFDQRRALAKVAATGRISKGTASGSVDVYLLGKAVDGFPKKGATNVNFSKSIAPPSAGFTYGWGPLSIEIKGGISGELALDGGSTQEGAPSTTPAGGALANAPMLSAAGGPGKTAGAARPGVMASGATLSGTPTPPHAGRCTMGIVPRLRATGTLTASVNAVVYRVKMTGTFVFLDIKLPNRTAVAARPPNLVEDFDARFEATYLSGEVALQIDTRIPQSLTDGFDWDKVYKKTLFDWDGLTSSQKLASFSAKTTKL